MNLHRGRFVLLLAFLCCGCMESVGRPKPATQAQTVPSNSAEKMSAKTTRDSANQVKINFPVGQWRVDILEQQATPREQDIALRWQIALSSDPSWFKSHLEKYHKEEFLPYHSKMGITEPEYMDFLDFLKTPRLKKVDEATVTIQADGTNSYLFSGDSGLPELINFKVDLDKDIVITPFGSATTRRDVPDSGKTPFGNWSGVTWKSQKVDFNNYTGTRIEFTFGKILDSGRHLLMYDLKEKTTTSLRSRFRILIFHRLPI